MLPSRFTSRLHRNVCARGRAAISSVGAPRASTPSVYRGWSERGWGTYIRVNKPFPEVLKCIVDPTTEAEDPHWEARMYERMYAWIRDDDHPRASAPITLVGSTAVANMISDAVDEPEGEEGRLGDVLPRGHAILWNTMPLPRLSWPAFTWYAHDLSHQVQDPLAVSLVSDRLPLEYMCIVTCDEEKPEQRTAFVPYRTWFWGGAGWAPNPLLLTCPFTTAAVRQAFGMRTEWVRVPKP